MKTGVNELTNELLEIDDIQDIAEGDRVIIYGIGSRGKDLFEAFCALRQDVEVVAFGDSFKAGRFMDRDVLTPDAFSSVDFDRILIASEYAQDIAEALPADLRPKAAIVGYGIVRQFNIDRGVGPFVDCLAVDLSRHCDMRCQFCFGPYSGFSGKDMPFDLFELAVRQIREGNVTKRINFIGDGEALLYPRLMQATRLAVENGIRVELTTNALSLTPERFIELSEAGVSSFMISMHNLSEKGFEHRFIGRKGNYALYRERILDCIEAKCEKGLESKVCLTLLMAYPHWPVVDMLPSEGIVEDTVNFRERFLEFVGEMNARLARHGCEPTLDLAAFDDMLEKCSDFRKFGYEYQEMTQGVYLMIDPLEPFHFEMALEQRPEFFDKYDFKSGKGLECPGISPLLWADGTVTPCCYAHRADRPEMLLGVVSEETTLRDMMTSPEYRRICKDVKEGRLPYRECATCLGTYEPKDSAS